MNNATNGWKNWVIYALFAAVLGLLGTVAKANYDRISKIEVEFTQVRQEQLTRTGRIAALESQSSELTRRLERMEAKIDLLLQERRK